jgi:hypothetical protein
MTRSVTGAIAREVYATVSTIEPSVQGVKRSEVLTILRNEALNAAHYLVIAACQYSALRSWREGFLGS